MLAVDICHHRQNRRQFEERTVAFVRFHHQNRALPNARIRTLHRRHASAHHNRRIEIRRIQNRRHHRRGGSFPMAASNGNAELQTHQFRQQFAARNHRNLQTARLRHFRIGRIERGRNNHRFRSGDIFGAMTHLDGCAQFA